MTAIADTVTPESLAAAAQARHDAVPTASPHGAAPAAPARPGIVTPALLTDLCGRIGTPSDLSKTVDDALKVIDDARARIVVADSHLLEWFVVARATEAQPEITARVFAGIVGGGAQAQGRLQVAYDLHEVYGRKGMTLTPSEARSQTYAKGKSLEVLRAVVARVAAGDDPLDVRGHNARGERVPGNYVIDSHLTVADTDTTPTVTVDPGDGTEPDTDTGAPDNGPGVVTTPNASEWCALVETMGANAHLLAAGNRDRMRAALSALSDALDTLDATASAA